MMRQRLFAEDSAAESIVDKIEKEPKRYRLNVVQLIVTISLFLFAVVSAVIIPIRYF
jgi:predicted histidine transporter YuiF (NhaC family)